MAIGNYGTKRLSSVPTGDIEVLYSYVGTRNVEPTNNFKPINGGGLTTLNQPDGDILPGYFNLKLPADQFSNVGIYNLMIRPRVITTTITDCGVLAAFPNIKGVILDTNGLGDLNSLVGSRIEYYDTNRATDTFTIITSVNRAEPITQNLPSTTQKAVRYRFNNNSNLVFLTVTPSSAPTVKPNSLPYVGQTGQKIKINKTTFDPMLIELELTEYDINSLAIGLYGNQSKGIQDGIYTLYNFSNEIYKQYNLYEIQDQFTGEPLYEIREQRGSIDETKGFDTITNIG
tara:strand:- start:20724 stop:21584 length:861 start_codon:yes stop_codon:yes gene_type:complete